MSSNTKRLALNIVQNFASRRAYNTSGRNASALPVIRQLSRNRWRSSQTVVFKVAERRRLNKELAELIEKNGPISLIRDYLRRGADPNASRSLLVRVANRPDVLELLISYGANVNRESLEEAIYHANVRSVKIILRAGVRVHTKHLGDAITSDQLEIVKLLLRHGANPHALRDGKSLLYYSVSTNRIEITAELIKAGKPFPPPLGVDALYAAVHLGFDEIASMLVNAGVDVNTYLPLYWADHRTILGMALELGASESILRLLIRRGANPNFRHKLHNISPYETALYNGMYDIAALFVREGGATTGVKFMVDKIVPRIDEKRVPMTVLRTIVSSITNLAGDRKSTNELRHVALAHGKPRLARLFVEFGVARARNSFR
jgi:ankyrin repeat protein